MILADPEKCVTYPDVMMCDGCDGVRPGNHPDWEKGLLPTPTYYHGTLAQLQPSYLGVLKV